MGERRVIPASEILEKIERGEPVEYDGVIVEGDLDISGLNLPTEHVDITDFEKTLWLSDELKLVSSQITITNSEIQGEVNFRNARFKEPINFIGAKFGGDTAFGKAKFTGDTAFGEAKFTGDAYFGEAKFGGSTDFGDAEFTGRGANFLGAKFTGDANFGGAKFGGDADFWGAKFDGDADFLKATFSGDANFVGATFGGGANFVGAKFGGDSNFGGAKFGGDADFGVAKFDGDAIFWVTEFDKRLQLNGFKCDRLYITWDSIKNKLDYDRSVYLTLVKNFKALEQFDDADNCYYQYRQESKARKKWNRNNQIDWSKLSDWFGYLVCGYGVKLHPMILSVTGIAFGFTFLYKLLPESYGGIAESGPSTVTMEALNNSTLLLTFSSGDGTFSPTWGECLYFSFTALTGSTPNGLYPEGLLKYAVIAESVLGYLFLALFVVVLARKIIR